MCAASLEYQLINPTTQVALFSVCLGNCSSLQNITWNIYNSSGNSSQWTLFNQTNSLENIGFLVEIQVISHRQINYLSIIHK